jgi:hypothetical protein
LSTGSDLCNLKTSVTRSLCDQIFTSPIHWSKATDFPESATHAIDFGPGGLSGIGPLTARNLDGRGVRVIVVGDRGKGDAELYDARDIKYEDWWSKKWSPSLVRTRLVYTIFVTHSSLIVLLVMVPFTSIRLSLASWGSRLSWWLE